MDFKLIKNMKKIVLMIAIVTLGAGNLRAQSSQLTGQPLLVNPAFAGSMGVGRISFNTIANNILFYQNINQNVSYDFFLNKMSTGIGLSFGYTNCNPLRYNFKNNVNTFAELAIAPKISLKGKYTLSPAASVNYTHNTSSFPPFFPQRENVNITGGLMFNSKKFYTGYTYKRSLNFNTGYSTFLVGGIFQRSNESDFSFAPSALWHFGKHNLHGLHYIDPNYQYSPGVSLLPKLINMNFRYKRILWGAGIKFTPYSPAFLMVGYQSKNTKFKITTSLSPLRYQEFTIRYLFSKPENKGRLYIKD
jgi:hypothetical protein